MKPDHLIAIAIGGVLGAVVRWGVVDLFPSEPIPYGVLFVNTLGSLLIGGIMAWALHPERRKHPVISAAGAGFCGSFTTFSALAVTVASELRDGAPADGMLALGLSLGFGLSAAWAGWHLTEWAVHRHEGAPA